MADRESGSSGVNAVAIIAIVVLVVLAAWFFLGRNTTRHEVFSTETHSQTGSSGSDQSTTQGQTQEPAPSGGAAGDSTSPP